MDGQALGPREALALAMGLHRDGNLGDAETVYRRILEVAPRDPDTLHYLGVLCHQRGRSEEAIRLIGRALEAIPESADAHNNLGNVFQQSGRVGDAAAAYRRALELRPDDLSALNNLAVALRVLGRLDEAIAAHRRAVELEPRFAEAYLGLGKALREAGDIDGAVDAFHKVIALEARHERAYKNLGGMLYRVGRHAEAVSAYEAWLEQDPGNPVAQHMLAASSGVAVPARASDGYVRQTFDVLASGFDENLRQLQYRAPELAIEALAAEVGEPSGGLDVLDAGCGTGLCGPLLRPYARRLVGVDLSTGMLDKARGRDVYDELVLAELTGYLEAQTGVFDVIVSTDTLIYFGELGAVLDGARRALRADGCLVFTVESAEPAGPLVSPGYRITPSGRYSHHQQYLRDRLSAAGLTVVSAADATLRREAGGPVAGYVVTATRP